MAAAGGAAAAGRVRVNPQHALCSLRAIVTWTAHIFKSADPARALARKLWVELEYACACKLIVAFTPTRPLKFRVQGYKSQTRK